MKIFTKRILLVVLMAFALPASFYGQNIFSNAITGSDPGLTTPYTEGQVVATNVTASGIARGSGLTGNAANNRYNASAWNLTAFDADDYFSFTLTPAAGYTLNFTDFQYIGQKSGTGPKYFSIRTSVDNYAADVYTYSSTGSSSTTFPTQTASLSAAAFQDVAGPVTFRFYGWGGTGDAGTFSINEFAFNGTVEAAVAPCGEIALPTAAAQSFCGSGTVAQLTATGTALKWYAAQTGGTVLAGTTALTTGTYYVSQTIGTCESNRVAVAVTVNTIPAAPTASAQSFCGSGTVAQLTATGTAPIWYAAQTGGTALEGTAALATGTYYVSQTVNGCESTRTSVAVTVNTIPAAPTASAQSFCGSGTVAQLTATGSALTWYAAQTGGTALEGTAALATGTYYVSQTVNGCESTRTSVAVTVNLIPAAPTASAQSFCGSGTVAQLTATGTGLVWYAAQTGGTALEGTSALATGTYYVSQTINGCESTRTSVAVTVNAIPAAPTASAQSFCGSGTVAQLTATGTALVWYATQTGGTALEGTAALATGTYYVSQTVNGCESTRISVAVTVNTIPAAPTASAQSFCGSGTVAQLTATGTAPIWYAAQTGGSALEGTAVLATGTYYVSQTVNGCESTRTSVAVTVNTIPAAPTASAQSFCGSGTVAQLTATGTAPIWYTAQTGGTALEGTAALATGTYYVSQTVNGCESTRTSVAVTVTTLAQPDGDATQDFTEGQTVADLDVTGDAITWYADEALTDEISEDTVLEDGVTYYAVATNGDCESIALAITVSEVAGTDGFEKAQVSVYPNPVNDVLFINSTDTLLSVEVYNLLGQQVLSVSPKNQDVKVDMSVLGAGAYVVKAATYAGVKTVKVIKQ